MGDEHVERRRETLGLGRPIGEQRSRSDDQARPPLAAARGERQQQGQHLDGLAEPHVVGKAGAEAETREKASQRRPTSW